MGTEKGTSEVFDGFIDFVMGTGIYKTALEWITEEVTIGIVHLIIGFICFGLLGVLGTLMFGKGYKAKIAALEKSNQAQGERIDDLEGRLKQSNQIINALPLPETTTWIGKAVVRHKIMQSSLMLKIVARWNRPGDYHSTSAFLERARDRVLYGSSDKDAYEARQEEEAFQYYLERIVTEYPAAQNKDGGYSNEIIEFALGKMAVEE